MRHAASMIFVLLVTAGCVTADLPRPTNQHPSLDLGSEETIGVPDALDLRESERAGRIGAAFIQVKKEDLIELVTSYLVQYLNDKVGLNVVRVPMEKVGNPEIALKTRNLDGLVIFKIKELQVFSLDALLQPVRASLTLELLVLNHEGLAIYNRTVTTHEEKRFGIANVSKETGKLVERVVKEALSELVKDQALRKIIKELKSGSLQAGTNLRTEVNINEL